MDNSQPFLAQIEVLGNSIKIWYLEIYRFGYSYARQRALGNPILEYDLLDDIEPGGVGIWQEKLGFRSSR